MKSPKELRTLAEVGARYLRSPEKKRMDLKQMQVPTTELLVEIGGLHMQVKQQTMQTNLANNEIRRLNTELAAAQKRIEELTSPKPTLVPDAPGVESGDDAEATQESQKA